MAYRNVYYDYKKSEIHLWGWDTDGNRQKFVTEFKPFLYLESKDGDATSIFGTKLEKKEFRNHFDRSKFIEPLKRVFFNLNVDQQFLLTTFKDEVDKENYGSQPLKIFYIDIETYATDHFSTPEAATDPINLITVYDSLSERYYTWGCKNYSTTQEDVIYIKCKDERDLLQRFVKFWKNDPPDIITGWNIHGYDIPYIMNRLNILFSDGYNKKLSPIESIYLKKDASVNKLGRSIDRWMIFGVSIIDYMELYEALCGGKRESMSLNYISEYELGENKIAIGSTSLSTMADTDWFKFVDYNIQDVRLLINLEKKLKYLKLVRNLAYRGFIPFEKSMGKVAMITGAVAHEALKQNLIIPTFNIKNTKQDFAGGFVHEPVKGLYENVVTYDANSLYPNTIITLNISTETKVGKILKQDEKEVEIITIKGDILNLKRSDFEYFVEQNKIAITKANVLYSQLSKGIIPTLIDRLYSERVNAKNRMLDAKKKIKKETDPLIIKQLEEDVNDNDTLSNVYKVFLNSVYGAFSNIYFPLFDMDHAESVTLSGQAIVKKGPEIVYDYAKSQGFKGKLEDILIYQDTDSEFFSFNEIMKTRGINLLKDGEISKEAYEIIVEYGDVLNKGINDWAKQEFRSIDPRYVFKREKICDAALLQAKKFYILHILDKEGVKTKEFEYKGMEVAKATLSKEVKELIKDVIESAILAKNRKKANEIFNDGYEKFCNMSPEEIATRKKINNYDKWDALRKMISKSNKKDIDIGDGDDDINVFGKGTPIHVKSSMNFNEILTKLNIKDKYPSISGGSKIKFFYCDKNIYDYETIGFIDYYPKEILEVIKPDYRFIFEKNVVPVIERIFQIIGWPIPMLGCIEATDLTELFS
jgi:DNA polymerase elongation subunit (family B)